MSDFRLCIARRPVTPYYCLQIRKEIYTIEELSYFIFENIHLLDEKFLNRELIAFVKGTIDEDLTGFGFMDAILLILRSNNFYSDDDIRLIEDILRNYKEGDYAMRAKRIGDKCLINKDYNMAIRHYDNILARSAISGMPEEFVTEVYFNKGVAMARQLNFKEAYEIFDRLTWKLNDPLIHLYRMIALHFFDRKRFDTEMQFADEEIRVAAEELIRSVWAENIDYGSRNDRYMVIIDSVIEDWKRQIGEGYIE